VREVIEKKYQNMSAVYPGNWWDHLAAVSLFAGAGLSFCEFYSGFFTQ
jgi:hypothetical protein